ncbi:MAG: 4-hydroxy-tetrahydrodipicolinate synthase [Vulcanimicrobiota bacterium]
MTNRFGLMATAMVTPFTDNLEVDYDKAAKLAVKLVEEGNDSLVVCGTTGESPVLSSDEKVKLFKTVKTAVGPKVPVIAGTGSYDTKATIKLSLQAAEAGADALLLVAPYYNKPSQEGLYQHFQAIFEAVELPAMLYNIPGRTGVEILPETLARLAEHPRAVAVKQSLLSVDPISDLSARLSRVKVGAGASGAGEASMAIYSGDDSNILPHLSVGGKGVVSVAGHVAARPIKQMLEAFVAGRVQDAIDLHLRLFPLFKVLFVTSNPAPVKAALALQGFPVGGVRLPLVAANADEVAQVKAVMSEAGLL